MGKITFLQPTKPDAKTSKTYKKTADGRIETTGEYDLGVWFKWRTVDCTSIQTLYALYQKVAESRVIRIYGQPKADMRGKTIRRKKVFCESNTRTDLLMFDIDGWSVPQGHSLATPESIRATFVHLFIDVLKWTFLDGVSFMVMFSSSHWNKTIIKAHVYFLIAEEVPLLLINNWSKAHNALQGDNKGHHLDPAVYRSVQPDYITRRTCLNFSDPLSESARLLLFDEEDFLPVINSAELANHFSAVFKAAESILPIETTTGVVKSRGPTWEETVKLCGTAQHGINEPAYLAASQLVAELGSGYVKQNLATYIDKLHRLMWESIRKHGLRGNISDRQKYDKTKVRNYITTCIDKSFGKEPDLHFNAVNSIIDKVVAGSPVSLLFDRDALESLRYLKAKHPGKYVLVRQRCKTELQGALRLADLEKSLSGVRMTADVVVSLNKLLDEFQWVEGDTDKGLYCKIHNSSNYALVPVEDGVENDLYVKAIEIFDEAPPPMFEKKALSLLVAKHRSAKTTRFLKAPVEHRCYSKVNNNKTTTYVNLGMQYDEEMRTAKITGSAPYIDLMHSNESPILWRTGPYAFPIPVNDVEEYRSVYGDDFRQIAAQQYLERMQYFFSASDMLGFIDIVAWQIISCIHLGVSYILELTGSSKSGKSTTASLAKETFDPSSEDLRIAVDLHNNIYKAEDIARILRKRHVMIIDNLNNLNMREQDQFCLISTGWKLDLRLLYTNQFIPIMVKRPIIFTGISSVITNQDLRTRSVSVYIEGGAEDKQMKDDLLAQWYEERPDLVIGFFSLVSLVIEKADYMRSQKQDVNARDFWLKQGRRVVMKLLGYYEGVGADEKEQEALIDAAIQDIDIRRDIEEAILNSRTSILIAWVLHCSDFAAKNELIMSSQDAYMSLKNWANNNAGQEVKIAGSTIEISPKNIPNNARMMGSSLGKHAHDLSTVTRWRITKLRTSTTRGWRFKHL